MHDMGPELTAPRCSRYNPPMSAVLPYATDVLLERTEIGYQVCVIDADGEQVAAPFVSPFVDHANFSAPPAHDSLGAFWRSLMDHDGAGIDSDRQWSILRSMGTRLFEALFPGELVERLHAGFRHAYQQQRPMTLRLNLDESPDYYTLPWEYLYDPIRREFPALSIHSPIMRYDRLMHHIRPLPVRGPLRMLVVIAEPSGHPRFGADREWLKLIDTLDYLAIDGRFFLERLRKPTLFDLRRQLRSGDYHIVHFIGHTHVDGESGEGRLVLEDEMGRGRPISGNHLGQILRDHYDTRLVTIQSMVEHFDPRQPAGHVAAQLIPRGVPAAISLPVRIGDELTLAFWHELYAAVAALRPIGIAMAEARGAIVAEGNAPIWGLPWLLSRADDGYLFDDGSLPSRKPVLTGRHRPSLLERVLRSNLVDRPFDADADAGSDASGEIIDRSDGR